MNATETMMELANARSAVVDTAAEGPLVRRLGEVEDEYRATGNGCAVFPHTRRGLIHVSGKDRAAWLHNLCTQNIKLLQPGEGAYAFSLNVKGRILFDLFVWADAGALWVDVDRRLLPLALRHFTKYVVTEDVALEDCTEAHSRLAILGPGAREWLGRVASPHLASLAHYQHCTIPMNGADVRFIRTDCYGAFAVELSVPAPATKATLQALIGQSGCSSPVWVGWDAMEIRRVESGIPWPVSDLFDDILPAETRQLERAVNFQKGCYLGQEIVERMRSRGGLSRSLVGLAFDGQPPMSTAEPRPVLLRAEHPTGILTSACYSHSLRRWIGLGYVKLNDANPGTELSVASPTGSVAAIVQSPPFSVSQ